MLAGTDPLLIAGCIYGGVVLLIVLGCPAGLVMLAGGGLGVFALMGENAMRLFPTVVGNAFDLYVLLMIPTLVLCGTAVERAFAFGRYTGRERQNPFAALWPLMVAASTTGGARFGSVSSAIAVERLYARGVAPGIGLVLVHGAAAIGCFLPSSLLIVVVAFMVGVSISKLMYVAIAVGVCLLILVLIAMALNLPATDREVDVKPLRRSDPRGRTGLEIGLPAVLVFFLMLGPIFVGITTPTEAVSLVVLPVLLAFFLVTAARLRAFRDVVFGASSAVADIMLKLAGASVLSAFLSFSGAPGALADNLLLPELPQAQMLLICLALLFVCALLMEAIVAAALCLPVIVPLLAQQGYGGDVIAVFSLLVLAAAQLVPVQFTGWDSAEDWFGKRVKAAITLIVLVVPVLAIAWSFFDDPSRILVMF